MLRVWLPLTKDLRQQGLSNVTVTNNGATFNSEGKLGGCYSFDGSDDFISLNSSALYDIIKGGSTPFSIAMWVYRADSTRAVLFGDYSLSGGIGFNIELTTAHKLRFYWNGSPDVNTSATCTLSTWSHVAIVYDGTKICFYVNGSLDYTYTITLSTKTKTTGLYYIGRDNRTGSTAFNGRLNDFRLYDHALSQMEVKELAKGLVLHYPLNRQGWGQENLYTTSQDFSGSWNNKSNWTTSEETYQNFIVKQKSTVWGGLSQNIPCSNGDIFTISFYAKVDVGGRICSVHRSSLGNVTTGLTILGGNFISGTDWVNATNDGIQWKRYWATVRIDSSDITYLQWRIENSIADKTLYICGMKMERGSIATPWCPNSSDVLAATMGLNSTTEYDCSGFCNNGTRTGTFGWTSDTPKYQVSTKFSQSRIQCNGDFLYGLSTATLSAWVKLTAYHSERCMVIYANGRYLTINNSGQLSGYSYGKTPAGYYNSNQTIPLNTWTHITIVWDDTTWYFYINGTLVNSWACTGTFTNVGSYASVGQESNGGRSVSGLISDARIYATALSADDVKSLYQNSAYIDSNGNVYGAVHSEV